ncbi:uncharacterized protein LTR77_009459 [Saxophila tyrrhenica]|uniref:Uncharacterized protein n=1 Tax=Saxophila tyrrhenica TaxID=1690608 RepID=A0AAV9NYE5_9PEZI|nr:hypothetical protein LTR77_009459 [Saxophila tyrrhenica]
MAAMAPPERPQPDAYDNNPSVLPHFSPTPYSTFQPLPQTHYFRTSADGIKMDLDAIYRTYRLSPCYFSGLFHVGTRDAVADPETDNTIVMVFQVTPEQMWLWRAFDRDVRQVLSDYELDGLAGVCSQSQRTHQRLLRLAERTRVQERLWGYRSHILHLPVHENAQTVNPRDIWDRRLDVQPAQTVNPRHVSDRSLHVQPAQTVPDQRDGIASEWLAAPVTNPLMSSRWAHNDRAELVSAYAPQSPSLAVRSPVMPHEELDWETDTITLDDLDRALDDFEPLTRAPRRTALPSIDADVLRQAYFNAAIRDQLVGGSLLENYMDVFEGTRLIDGTVLREGTIVMGGRSIMERVVFSDAFELWLLATGAARSLLRAVPRRFDGLFTGNSYEYM